MAWWHAHVFVSMFMRRPSRRTDGILWLALDPATGDYNAELIQISFEGGRVVALRYLPD